MVSIERTPVKAEIRLKLNLSSITWNSVLGGMCYAVKSMIIKLLEAETKFGLEEIHH